MKIVDIENNLKKVVNALLMPVEVKSISVLTIMVVLLVLTMEINFLKISPIRYVIFLEL